MKKRINMVPKPSNKILVKVANEIGTVIVSVDTEISEHEFVRDVLTVETTIYKNGRRNSYTRPKYQRGGVVPNWHQKSVDEKRHLAELKSEHKKKYRTFYEKTPVL